MTKSRALEILEALLDDLRAIEDKPLRGATFIQDEVRHAREEALAALERACLLGDLGGQ